jgi:hypothetical protein
LSWLKKGINPVKTGREAVTPKIKLNDLANTEDANVFMDNCVRRNLESALYVGLRLQLKHAWGKGETGHERYLQLAVDHHGGNIDDITMIHK